MPKHHDEYDDKHEDDDLVIEEYDLTLLDEDESYEAVIIYAKRITFYHREMIDFVFQITSHGRGHSARLRGYCPFDRCGRQSKITRWRRVITGHTKGSPSKVTLRAFKQYLYRVRIETVTTDRHQQPLAPCNQYSKVAEILEVIGPLKTDGEGVK